MFLIIVGRGAMGKVLKECAENDDFFDRVETVEPTENIWPAEKADLIIDFSHPKALKGIYEYCREMGGNIPVVIGTTGHDSNDEEIIRLISKICPVDKRSNFSKGIEVMNKITHDAMKMMPGCDIAVEEIHHKNKKDAPSGTAKTLCSVLGISPESVSSHRLGTMFGQHKVYLALEDEVIEISHTAYSKKIFAKGAIEAAKTMIR